jgi:hypothetical protein
MISSSVAQVDNPKIQSLVDSITELNNSLNVVLSIDCSGSMENESAKNAALGFLSQLKNGTKGNIDVGYVAWSKGILAESLTLNSDISEVYKEINNRNLKNNSVTCMSIGLDKSIKLLRDNKEPGKHNILIVISDGMDNCTSDLNLNCGDIRQEINAIGINIYTIQIGNDPEGRELLECLENTGDVPSADAGKTQGFRIVEKLPRDMTFQAEIKHDSIPPDPNNMTVSKDITWGDHGPRIALAIKVPSARDIPTNVAIALDSSGSLGWGGRPEYGDNIREAMLPSLEKIRDRLDYSKVSIISWDEDIDFAYGDLNNTDPSKARLVPTSIAIDDITKNDVFMYKDEGYLQKLWAYFWGADRPLDHYYCRENESTNMSIGLDSARAVLNNTKGTGIRKMIILITARSEYEPCDPKIIRLAKNQSCNIYTIGIGVINGSLLENELKEIASDRETKYKYSSGSQIYDKNAMDSVIENAVDQFLKENISNNILINETLYPYIQAKNDTVNATLNGKPIYPIPNMRLIKTNPDRTTTWKIEFKGLNIKPEDELIVYFDTTLNISLPADVTKFRTSIDYSIDRKTTRSSISYRWLADNKQYEIGLPERNIEIN